MTSPQPLLILGASVRAAAFSARRGGFSPWCADLFADVDLGRLCPVVRIEHYPRELIEAAASAPSAPWIYTGGLENYPDLVDQIMLGRPLYGNRGDVLAGVRDPFLLARTLREAGIACPVVATAADARPDGSWLRKPRRSSGGLGVAVWRGDPEPSGQAAGRAEEYYFQQRIGGESCSAVFLAAGGRAVLLGATRQFVGAAWGTPREFQYAGSLGPLRLKPGLRDQFERIGRVLAARFALVGLFGVDAILSDEAIFPVEVNPRYPASVEVFERSTGRSAVRLHVDACRSVSLPRPPTPESVACYGKLILYARSDVTIPASFDLVAHEMAQSPWPDMTDIPAPGTLIRAGLPVVTLHGQSSDEAGVVETLRERAAWVEAMLYPSAVV